MKLSIITTIYKAEKDLPRLLDSMIQQKSPELEFFLIDNGSPDRCGEICKEYLAKDPRFILYTIEENIGYIGARNKGLSLVDADYVGFCDSDDYLEPGGYDHAIEILKRYNCDLYLTSWNTDYGDKVVHNYLPYNPGFYTGEQIEENIVPNAFGPAKGKGKLHGFVWKEIFKFEIAKSKSFIEELKPYEDQIFNIDIISECASVYIDKYPIYNYVVNENSITANLCKHYDIQSDWERNKLLFYEKTKRVTIPITYEYLSIDCLNGILGVINNEYTCHNQLSNFSSLLTRDYDYVKMVIDGSGQGIGFRLSILKFCLMHKAITLLYALILIYNYIRALCFKSSL